MAYKLVFSAIVNNRGLQERVAALVGGAFIRQWDSDEDRQYIEAGLNFVRALMNSPDAKLDDDILFAGSQNRPMFLAVETAFDTLSRRPSDVDTGTLEMLTLYASALYNSLPEPRPEHLLHPVIRRTGYFSTKPGSAKDPARTWGIPTILHFTLREFAGGRECGRYGCQTMAVSSERRFPSCARCNSFATAVVTARRSTTELVPASGTGTCARWCRNSQFSVVGRGEIFSKKAMDEAQFERLYARADLTALEELDLCIWAFNSGLLTSRQRDRIKELVRILTSRPEYG